jgi:hypothetical protein
MSKSLWLVSFQKISRHPTGVGGLESSKAVEESGHEQNQQWAEILAQRRYCIA